MSYKSVLASSQEASKTSPGSPQTASSIHQSLYGSASWGTDTPPPPPADTTPSIYPPAKASPTTAGSSIPIPQLTSVVSGGGEASGQDSGSFNYGGFDPSSSAASAFQTTEDQRKGIEAFLSQSPSQALGDAFVGMGLEEDGGKVRVHLGGERMGEGIFCRPYIYNPNFYSILTLRPPPNPLPNTSTTVFLRH
jgi:hypothetical protein